MSELISAEIMVRDINLSYTCDAGDDFDIEMFEPNVTVFYVLKSKSVCSNVHTQDLEIPSDCPFADLKVYCEKEISKQWETNGKA
jgi:hypothetical protein